MSDKKTKPAAAEPAHEQQAVAHRAHESAVVSAEHDDIFEANAGSGMEKVTAADMLIPRLTLIQDLSPQLKPRNSEYIEGVKVGDIVDVGMGEIMPIPCMFIPIVWDKRWIEWAPRDSKKGIINVYPTDHIMSETKPDPQGKGAYLPNGNSVAETHEIYGINLSAGRRPTFIPFASTQLKHCRKWMSLAKGERLTKSNGDEYIPPLFFRSYLLGTGMTSNGSNEWASWTISRGPNLKELGEIGRYGTFKSLADLCIGFRDQIAAGRASADRGNMTDDPNQTVDHEPAI